MTNKTNSIFFFFELEIYWTGMGKRHRGHKLLFSNHRTMKHMRVTSNPAQNVSKKIAHSLSEQESSSLSVTFSNASIDDFIASLIEAISCPSALSLECTIKNTLIFMISESMFLLVFWELSTIESRKSKALSMISSMKSKGKYGKTMDILV